LGNTIIPWLLGVLFLFALMTLAVTIKTWRDMKRSPYFFLRRQAEKRMQTYSLASLALLMAATLTSRFAWQAPPDNTSRVAILENSKPPKADVVALVQETVENNEIDTAVPDSLGPVDTFEAEVPSSADTALSPETLGELPAVSAPSLPEELDELEAVTDIGGDTLIGKLQFSTEIDNDFAAINPRGLFAEGFYTLYASFAYEAMANGMEWSWVWRHNGTVVDGGNEIWNYGNDGLGYVYLSPSDGFQNGEYGLELWVNGELLSQSAVTMNNAALSAGN
jgi:hypothetical protein